METQNNPDSYHGQKGWRSREQKEEIILQWQQSGKSRKAFCEENGITYNSLAGWCKQMKDKKSLPGFTEVKLKSESGLFAQVHLPGGIRMDFFQPVSSEFLRSLK